MVINSSDENMEITTCRSCGAQIYWTKTKSGKAMPISVATNETHFADCPQSKKWSGQSRGKDGKFKRDIADPKPLIDVLL